MNIRFQLKQFIKQAVQNLVLPVCYNLQRCRKTDPKLVVFADAHHDSRPAAMELLYHRLKKDGSWKIIEHYLDYGQAGAAGVAKPSVRFMGLYARAVFVVICDNFLPASSCRKKKETKLIQLWHACGCYKKFGYDAKDDIPENYHGANVYRNADLVTVSGKAAAGPFSSAMRLPESCVQPLGVSRTDLYRSKTWILRCEERFYSQYPQAKGKKVVLWAPTFRGNAGAPESINVDLGQLQNDLGEEYLVLARLHPHMMRSAQHDASVSGKNGPAGSGHGTEDTVEGQVLCPIPTEELYPVTDVLIADYSSLIYEYLLFGKPVVLYCPDLETYRRRRGFYMDISSIPGEIIVQGGEKALATVVRKARTEPGKMEDFLDRYMGACDGHATGRIIEWMDRNRQGSAVS